MRLYHEINFPDPLLYVHLTDTLNGQIHILLYILNNPSSPRFNVDKMPDGSPTQFGTLQRNIEAENNAFVAGLAPGQVRHGLRMWGRQSNPSKIHRCARTRHVFRRALYYHVAVIFERYGFSYQVGKR